MAAAIVVSLLTGSAAADTASNTLPIRRGYYVDAGTPCGSASMATLVTMRHDGVGAGRVLDRFKRVEKTGPTTYRVTMEGIDVDGNSDGTSISEFQIGSSSRFRWKTVFGVSTMRFCSQASLPEPWRTNDIRALIK